MPTRKNKDEGSRGRGKASRRPREQKNTADDDAAGRERGQSAEDALKEEFHRQTRGPRDDRGRGPKGERQGDW